VTVELASVRALPKPWGSSNLQPWSKVAARASPIGELWFGRADPSGEEPALLLKLLFTTQPLSIQVHPDDEYARSVGLPHGKTEAWYIVAASLGSEIALGLNRRVGKPELRAAIETGSVTDLVSWQAVRADEAVLVPAGTIHAIGAGLVIAEIQQRSDATFRLFDYERHRQLHVEDAVGAAIASPATERIDPRRLSDARRVMASSRYFVLEQISLPPDSHWELLADTETWLLVLSGEATFDLVRASQGEAIFAEGQSVNVRTEQGGLKGLIAYATAKPVAGLLRRLDEQTAAAPAAPGQIQELPT